MTIAEVLLLIVGGYGLYLLLAPLRRWFERRLLAMFSRPGRRQSDSPPIDITAYTSRHARGKDDEA